MFSRSRILYYPPLASPELNRERQFKNHLCYSNIVNLGEATHPQDNYFLFS